MPRRFALALCASSVLSSVLLASNGATSSSGADSPPRPISNERGVPALFSWGDVDGDGRVDLAAVSGTGALQLLVNTGDGRFEDVTERSGLSDIGDARLASWADYDGDGRLDLFVGAREGASRLLHNEHGVFIDMTSGSGFASHGPVESAQWIDYDADGRADLVVVTREKSELFRGLGAGYFERVDMPLSIGGIAPVQSGVPMEPSGRVPPSDRAAARDLGTPIGRGALGDGDHSRDDKDTSGSGDARHRVGGHASTTGSAMNFTSIPSFATPFAAPLFACATAIRDQANPNTCLDASTTPSLGLLYPISSNLFVAVGGNVGIGTTTPSARLHVTGTARITDTLTLAPSGDVALDVSTGNIYKGGAPFIHTNGLLANTAIGFGALSSVTASSSNTAIGFYALSLNTSGSFNTAGGRSALRSNTSGLRNTAFGMSALSTNTTGSNNTASGSGALYQNSTGYLNTAGGLSALSFNTTGNRNTASGATALNNNTTANDNTASGYAALRSNTTGSRNIALGKDAGLNLTTGNDNIAIGNVGVAAESATIRIGTSGTHTRAFAAGIRGVTTANADAIPVLVDSAGQLGTVSSSRRFKKDIRDMGDATARLLELRPVLFRYKQEQALPNGQEVPPEYGLIAEEVAEIFPDLVVYDDEGKPFTVKYHLLSSMLLNELKELNARHEEHSRELEDMRGRLAALESRNSPAPAPAAPSANH